MARSSKSKAAKMQNLVRNTNQLFAALQRVDTKVNDFVLMKTLELNDIADQMDTWSDIQEGDTPDASETMN